MNDLKPWQRGAIVGLLLGIFISITIGDELVLALVENQTLIIVSVFVLIGILTEIGCQK